MYVEFPSNTSFASANLTRHLIGSLYFLDKTRDLPQHTEDSRDTWTFSDTAAECDSKVF